FHPHPLTQAFADELCGNVSGRRDRYFVLWYRGRVAGYGLLRGWDEGFAIPSFGACTHPALRNAGIGQALLAYAIAEARGAGAEKMRLTVYERNTRALHIYQRFGFAFQSHSNGTLLGTLDLASAGSPSIRALDVERLDAAPA